MSFQKITRLPGPLGFLSSANVTFLATAAAVATALALLTTAQGGIELAHNGQAVPWSGLLKARLVDWYLCALFMPLLVWLARRKPVDRGSWTRTLPIHLLVAVPVAIAKEALFVAIGNLFRPGVFQLQTILAEDLSYEVIAVWALSALAHVLVFNARVAQSGAVARFVVRTRLGHKTVRADEIEYIDAQGNYARLVTPAGGFLIRETLTRLEVRLGPRFLRVHRRIIVRLDAIARIEPRSGRSYWLHLTSGEKIATGRTYAAVIGRLLRSR